MFAIPRPLFAALFLNNAVTNLPIRLYHGEIDGNISPIARSAENVSDLVIETSGHDLAAIAIGKNLWIHAQPIFLNVFYKEYNLESTTSLGQKTELEKTNRRGEFTKLSAPLLISVSSNYTQLKGSSPLYLEQLDSAQSTEWNIATRVLPTGALLNTEPLNYLLQEVRNPTTYNAVIAAIARGCVRPAEISDTIHIDRARVDVYLKNLIELLIVERTTPVMDSNRKKVRYRIADNLFRFWYTFMPKYGSLVDHSRSDAVARRIMKKELPTFVGPAFEDMCRQWIMRQVGRDAIDILPQEIGSWWGTDPRSRKQEEIDIVAQGIDSELLLGKCKWRNAAVDVDVLDRLVERAGLFTATEKQLYLFSKAGFTDACQMKAERMGNVRLIELEEMFEG